MSLIMKSDVKNHLSRRNHTGIHLFQPVSRPDATGFSGEETGSAAVNSQGSAGDTHKQPSSSGMNLPVAADAPSSSGPLTPVESKSAKA
jgi:hypothetical protein